MHRHKKTNTFVKDQPFQLRIKVTKNLKPFPCTAPCDKSFLCTMINSLNFRRNKRVKRDFSDTIGIADTRKRALTLI